MRSLAEEPAQGMNVAASPEGDSAVAPPPGSGWRRTALGAQLQAGTPGRNGPPFLVPKNKPTRPPVCKQAPDLGVGGGGSPVREKVKQRGRGRFLERLAWRRVKAGGSTRIH